MLLVESTALSQRLIHGEVRTEVCKLAVGAFVLALVTIFSFSGSESLLSSYGREGHLQNLHEYHTLESLLLRRQLTG